jgi:hypothetical protein
VSSSKIVTGRIAGAIVSFIATALSKISIKGFGRRRPPGSHFCAGSRASPSFRLALAAALTAAVTGSVSLSLMYRLTW